MGSSREARELAISPPSCVRDAPACSSPGCGGSTLACRDKGRVRIRLATVLRMCLCTILWPMGARIFCLLLVSFSRRLPSDPNITGGAGTMHKRPGAVRLDETRLWGEGVAPGPPPWRAAEDGRGSHGRREPGRLTGTRWGRCGARDRRGRQRPTPWGPRRRRLPSPRAMSRRASCVVAGLLVSSDEAVGETDRLDPNFLHPHWRVNRTRVGDRDESRERWAQSFTKTPNTMPSCTQHAER